MSNRSHLTPEQQESAATCDQLTDMILAGTEGLSVGIVIGACLNVLDQCANYLPAELRIALSVRMTECAHAITAKRDTPPGKGH